MRILQLSSLTFFLLISNEAQSAVIDYDELRGDGDLSNYYYSPTDLGAADVGMNTIAGQYQFSYDAWGLRTTNHDYAIFSVAEGLQIDSLIMNYWGGTQNISVGVSVFSVDANGRYLETVANFDIGPARYGITEYTDVLLLGGINSLDAGYYRLSSFQMHSDDFGAYTYGYLNYAWNINVTAVPVPGAIWLMLSGLLGLYSVSRKRNTQ